MLVDDPAIADVIARAADAWPAAQTGDDDALFELDEATAHDLMWFAIQEISGLLEDADRRQGDLDR
jgi:flavin-binding protein dodecin